MPPVQLLNVFPVHVFVGLVPEPSEFTIPVNVVAPVTVMLEKLLFVTTLVEPLGEDAPVVVHKTVPPALVLLNAVTIELLSMV